MHRPSPFDKFVRLIAQHVGYALQSENQARLKRMLSTRAAAVTGGQLEAYLDLLSRDSDAARAEWQEILRELTIGESFFFRDAPQFRLLRETILPQLLERRRAQRTLRIWSAGCSTGEEPYSLAILVRELLPADADWSVRIVGTDINTTALEHARQARYSAWSLRGLGEDERERYFLPEGGQWRLRPEYRKMVSFQRSNLVMDRIPSYSNGLHSMDLILCRNVFIYFAAATTKLVVEKLALALAPGGFLVTGHAELQGHPLAPLRTVVLPGSVVHERPALGAPPLPAPPAARAPAPAAESPPAPGAPAALALGLPPQDLLDEAEQAFQRADYHAAIKAAEAHLEQQPDDERALRLAALLCANLGMHARAARHCRRLLDLRPGDIEARYLLAKVAQDQHEETEAREILRGILSDAPAFVPAYLDLAWIEQRQGDSARAQNLREEALRLLRELPPDAILTSYEGLSVQDLLGQLKTQTSKEGA